MSFIHHPEPDGVKGCHIVLQQARCPALILSGSAMRLLHCDTSAISVFVTTSARNPLPQPKIPYQKILNKKSLMKIISKYC